MLAATCPSGDIIVFAPVGPKVNLPSCPSSIDFVAGGDVFLGNGEKDVVGTQENDPVTLEETNPSPGGTFGGTFWCGAIKVQTCIRIVR